MENQIGITAISALENLVLISKAPPQYFSSKIAINRSSTFQKFATFGKFFAKAEIAVGIKFDFAKH
jgi:hydrogenase maturation factor